MIPPRFRQALFSFGFVPLAAMFLSACASDTAPLESGVVWSESATSEKFTGKPWHGPFQTSQISATMNGLPEHKFVHVRFKLLVIGTWDGSNLVWGPDLWSMRVRGGQRVMFATIGNHGGAWNCVEQTFPDDFPWGLNRVWIGAKPLTKPAFPKLGDRDYRADSIQEIDVLIPHTGPSLTLEMNGVYDDPPSEHQEWGVSDFTFEPVATTTDITPAEYAKLWEELASPDGLVANRALWKFVSGGDKSIAFIAGYISGLGERPSGIRLGSPEGMRLHRAEKILRLLDGDHNSGTRVALELASPEHEENLRSMSKYIPRCGVPDEATEE
jgi:hypothetical protein